MSIQGRIGELSSKHRQLDEKIAEERKHAAADEFMIKKMKLQKLKIKEELQWLKAG